MEWEIMKRIYDDCGGKITFEALIHMELRNKEEMKYHDESKSIK